MLPLLYSEADLLPISCSTAMDDVPSLSKHWLQAPTRTELKQRIRDAILATGFHWMSYRSFVLRDTTSMNARVFASHANPRWVELYRARSNSETDAHLERALRSTVPVAWSVEGTRSCSPHESPTQRHHAQLLRDFGIESGMFVALPAGSRPNERTVFELSSNKPGHAWIDDSVLSRSLMLGLCLHDLLTVRMSVATATEGNRAISATQREILRHLARGRSNKQIAHKLQLSSDTVKYHLRELQRYFDARNRVQLVNSMMLAGED